MKTIMVVDDESTVQEKIKDFLKNNEYRIISAKDSREAFEKISKNEDDEYSLLLIDTPIPGAKDKYGLISMKPDTKITAYKSDEKDFLEKPFTKEELLDFIKSKM